MNCKLLILLGVSILTFSTTPSTFAARSAGRVASTSQGQGGQGKKDLGRALQRFKSALDQLNLTSDQKDKIQSIFTQAHSKLQRLKGQSDAKTQARGIIQQARKDILAVLDAAQKAKLIEILKNDRSQSKA